MENMRKDRTGAARRLLAAAVISCAFIMISFTGCRISVSAAVLHTQQEAVNWAKGQLGKGLDYDGAYGNQCVDLIKFYYKYLADAETYGNGSDYMYNGLPAGWRRVYSDYQPGDIAVWKPNFTYGAYQTSVYGHVGIITAVSASRITVVNQNFASQPYCTENSFPYAVIGCGIRPDFNSGSPAPSDTQAPVIRDVKVTDKNGSGYTVSCTVTDNVQLDRVQFPTWTVKNDQDDIQPEWWSNSAASGTRSGNTFVFRVNISDHNGEDGQYLTHIYAYDTAGNWSSAAVPDGDTFVDSQAPVISDVKVTDKSETGYTVTCTVTDNVKVDRVQFPTWTKAGGQDDIQPGWWSNPAASGTKDGDTYTFRVNISDHNGEYGQYITHIYAYDSAANAGGPAVVPSEDTQITEKAPQGQDTEQQPAAVPYYTSIDVTELTESKAVVYVVTPMCYIRNWYYSYGTSPQSMEEHFGNDCYRNINNYTITLQQLSPGTKYYFQMYYISDSEKIYSDVISFTTKALSVPSDPQPVQPDTSKPEPEVKKIKLETVSSPSKGKMKIRWERYLSGDGYQIAYSRNKNFPYDKTVYEDVNYIYSQKTISNLSRGKTYYVAVRAYRKQDGVKYYGDWSNVKKVKIKKK